MINKISLSKIDLPDFSSFHDESRVWIFQTDRSLNDLEVKNVQRDVFHYIRTWKSHGSEVKSDCDVISNRFIVLIADETYTTVGGCSQDSLMRFIQQLQEDYGIDLLNRLLVAYFDGNEIEVLHKDRLVDLIASGELSTDLLMFDNLVQNKKDFLNSWIKPISESWVKRFL